MTDVLRPLGAVRYNLYDVLNGTVVLRPNESVAFVACRGTVYLTVTDSQKTSITVAIDPDTIGRIAETLPAVLAGLNEESAQFCSSPHCPGSH